MSDDKPDNNTDEPQAQPQHPSAISFEKYRQALVDEALGHLGTVNDRLKTARCVAYTMTKQHLQDYAEFYVDLDSEGLPHVVGACGEFLQAIRDGAKGGDLHRQAVEDLFRSCLLYLTHESLKEKP